MLRLAFQGLRGRKGPFVGAFVALCVASALVMACGAMLQAGLTAGAPVERYAATPIVVAGDQSARINVGTQNEDSVPLYERVRLDAALTTRLAAVPGVGAAIADRSVPAQLRTPAGIVSGPTGHDTLVHPWASAALTPYTLASGHAPAGPTDLVVDAGIARRGHLAIGQHVRLASNGPAQDMTIAGIARTGATVDRQGAMFVTSRVAERLSGLPGRVDAIGILPAPGTDRADLAGRLRRALHGDAAVVATGDARGDVEHIENLDRKDAVIAIGGTFGGLALLIAMFVVGSTIGLSVMQREREVALLRAVAATPKQVRRMIMWEAILIGLVASAVGVLPGAALAQTLGHQLSDRGIAPEGMQVAVGLIPAVIAVFSSVLTSVGAVVFAGRRAARVQPSRALAASTAEPRLIGPVRIIGGLVSLAGSAALLALCITSDSATLASDLASGLSLALVITITFLGPVIARIAAWVAGGVLRRTNRVSGYLAVSNVRTSPRRFASAMTPLVLTVSLSCTMLFLTTTRDHASRQQADKRVTADLVIGSDAAGVPESAVDEIRATPGVATAVSTSATTLGPTLGSKYKGIPAAVVDPQGLDRVLDLDVKDGTLADLRDDTVALSVDRAAGAHVKVGDGVSVAMGDNVQRRARVVATYDRALGFGEVVVPRSMAAGHRTSPLADSVLIRTVPGTPAAHVATRLRALSSRYPGLVVGDRHDLAVRVDEDRQDNDWLFKILAGVVFAFTAIAVVNTLTMIALHRRRELAMLQLVGATTRQVRAMARWEAGMVVGLGIALGGATALVTLAPLSNILSGSLIPYAPPGLLVGVLGSAAAVGFLGSQLSTRLAMRTRPVDAIGLRD